MSAPPAPDQTDQSKLPRRRALVWVSLVVCLLNWMLVATQPDPLAWLTIFPNWTWLIGGLVLLAAGFVRSQWKWSLAMAFAWFLFACVNVHETRSLWRSMASSTRAMFVRQIKNPGIRIISLNCGGGTNAAAQEVFEWQPDLILFQESPPRDIVERIAADHWGPEAAVAWGPDASIVARGRLTLRQRSTRGIWTWATWHRIEGDVEVISLRLSPVPLRFDFWSANCWHSMTQLRNTHRQEIAEILAVLGQIEPDRKCLIGGDFNSPAHDAALKELNRSFRDPFDTTGVGWGNTIVNGFPVHRIDQFWITQSIHATKVRAISSRHSDHCLVVGDLLLDCK